LTLPDRPLSVAVFSDSVLPVLNGVSVSIASLVDALRERGHSVHIYSSHVRRHRDSDPNTRRFLSVYTPWTGAYPLAVPPFYAWFREFQQRRFDIVHTHTPFTVGMVGLRWAQSLDIPLVSSYHTRYDKYAHYVPFFPRPYVRYKVAKHTYFYYSSVRHVITPSNATLKWLRVHSVRTPASVVPTGVTAPLPFDREAVRRELGAQPDHCVVLYCGRIAKEKNIELVLQACADVMSDSPNVRLWLVGEGPAMAEYAAMARNLEIGDRVRFWGGMPRPEVDRFYAAADVFAFGSTTETQGLVVAEAMVSGLPAVVAAGGGAGAAVADGVTGFLVPNERAAMAARLRELVSRPEMREQMGRLAKERAAQMTVGRMADRVLGVYREVLGSGSEARSLAGVV
jgi:glycosyltransferase involved in cell wall biosynthesis